MARSCLMAIWLIGIKLRAFSQFVSRHFIFLLLGIVRDFSTKLCGRRHRNLNWIDLKLAITLFPMAKILPSGLSFLNFWNDWRSEKRLKGKFWQNHDLAPYTTLVSNFILCPLLLIDGEVCNSIQNLQAGGLYNLEQSSSQ